MLSQCYSSLGDSTIFKKGWGGNPDFPPTGQSESQGLHVQYMLGLRGHNKSDYSKVDNGNAGAEQLRITSWGRWLGHGCNGPEIYDWPQTILLSAHYTDFCVAGFLNLQDLMPTDLRWSWCNNNRNTVHNKCNMLESSQNHFPPPVTAKNCLPQNHSLVPKRLRTVALWDFFPPQLAKMFLSLQL